MPSKPNRIDLIQQAGLGRLANVLASDQLPSIRLQGSEQPAEDAVTRLGGRPNLPPETLWPTRHNGSPLAFLAQFDLSTLPPLAPDPLPPTGSLFFFYDAVDQPWGFDPNDRDGFRVIYSNTPLAPHPLRPFPEDLAEEAQFKSIPLDPVIETTIPGINSPAHQSVDLSEEEFETYLDLTDETAPLHRIGGHADEIQGPLEIKAQLVSHGIYCGDPEGYEEGHTRGLDAGAVDWRLLLQVSSDDQAAMMWGDMGRLYFMIHKDDLRDLRFDKVWTILQCS